MSSEEKRNETVNYLKQCTQSMEQTSALYKLSMQLKVLLDGLNRCDAKLDAKIAGGLPCGTNKKNPECFDQAFYLRLAGELPKIKTKKNPDSFDEARSDKAFEMRISLNERIQDEIQ
ncbi:MAG: hypothetical protein EZS28_029111 [Streblomastix strix]|uniref:Uncharacterized protein n=1 Tax=Streblomastix strix TaxID=222440 RepID=A0A5J4UYS4_9EUKA|nr:MAG: hypothetical protein EZS28_029111 [Streblomastix strix]